MKESGWPDILDSYDFIARASLFQTSHEFHIEHYHCNKANIWYSINSCGQVLFSFVQKYENKPICTVT